MSDVFIHPCTTFLSSSISNRSPSENRSSSISTVVTPCPSLDHNYLLQSERGKHASRKHAPIERTKSTGSIEYSRSSLIIVESFRNHLSIVLDEPSTGDTEEDDERDSSSSVRPVRKSIITTRAQAAARSHSHNRRKSSPPKKRSSLLLPPHRPNTRISRRIIEQDLKLLRQANVLPPLSPLSNQQPLDLSLGPSNRSSSFEEVLDASNTKDEHEAITSKSTAPIEGVLDLSLSR